MAYLFEDYSGVTDDTLHIDDTVSVDAVAYNITCLAGDNDKGFVFEIDWIYSNPTGANYLYLYFGATASPFTVDNDNNNYYNTRLYVTSADAVRQYDTQIPAVALNDDTSGSPSHVTVYVPFPGTGADRAVFSFSNSGGTDTDGGQPWFSNTIWRNTVTSISTAQLTTSLGGTNIGSGTNIRVWRL